MPTQAIAMTANDASYSLAPLPYGYADLEPIVDEPTMRLHHDKHHKAYTDGINAALAKHPSWQGMSIDDVLRRLSEVPADIRDAVRNQGGGYANHNLFWNSLTSRGGEPPGADLVGRIDRSFGSLDQFMKRFEESGARQFGSGWVFLTVNPGASSALEIIALPNQDSPLSSGRTPLLACDVWEHAYYLKYNSRRPQWLHAWWDVVDWRGAAQRFDAAHAL